MLFILGSLAAAQAGLPVISFNLVIEMLFILGSGDLPPPHGYDATFQSRNRDAFHFRKPARMRVWHPRAPGFNLVIEMLFILGGKLNTEAYPTPIGFNLVIEMLFILGCNGFCWDTSQRRFQSRNRDAFHFRMSCQ